LRWGVYVTFRAPSEYVRRCFAEYGLKTDASGWYGAMYRPYHLIGLELGLSIAAIMTRGEPTGVARGFRGDVAATAKRDLAAGEKLDGEGGATVYGQLMPARTSLARRALPIGLAQGASLKTTVAAGQTVLWDDCAVDMSSPAVQLRLEMERTFRAAFALGEGEAGTATRRPSGA
jgi:predicted homoserine dehydrogenase-like protein